MDLYQQSAVTLWLGTQSMIANMTGGCTELDNAVTVAGYSEGGMAAFPVSQALNRIGVTILSCIAGAPVTDVTLWGKWAVGTYESIVCPHLSLLAGCTHSIKTRSLDQADQGMPSISVGVNLAYFGHAYSSTNPDLANTNVGQDLLAEEWMDPSDFSMNAGAWISSNLTSQEVATYVPFPDYLQILNPNVVEMMRVSL